MVYEHNVQSFVLFWKMYCHVNSILITKPQSGCLTLLLDVVVRLASNFTTLFLNNNER